MKNSFPNFNQTKNFTKKFFIIPFLFFLSFTIYGQTTIQWIGGASEAPIAWENPRNWSLERVPDVNDKVFIKYTNNGHSCMPTIVSDVRIAEISLHPKTTLTIAPNATLTVDGTDTYTKGIELIGGKIHKKGDIFLRSIDAEGQIITKQVAFE